MFTESDFQLPFFLEEKNPEFPSFEESLTLSFQVICSLEYPAEVHNTQDECWTIHPYRAASAQPRSLDVCLEGVSWHRSWIQVWARTGPSQRVYVGYEG